MDEIPSGRVTISEGFWASRLLLNASKSIFHQWEQLEASHCIDNFRLVTGEMEGFREGWFFSDSDAYKWLEAASNIYLHWPSDKLAGLMDEFVALLERAQEKDGYLFTYNQVNFPAEPRWQNNLIEHELYCHGHLIESGVAHFQATGKKTALDLAVRAADLLVRDFLETSSWKTSGHEEIEIALLRLFELTGRGHYLELARAFMERRGKLLPIPLYVLLQNASVNQRKKVVQARREEYLSSHPEHSTFQLPADNAARTSRLMKFRWQVSALSGKYFQMHTPIRKQAVPVGHSVRFAYLQTAVAKLYRQDNDETLLPALVKAWDRMVTRRMYVTGGIGSLPELEGFGRDYELDPEFAYAETCAALGSLFWNWEMSLITGEARYTDLFEWQLYNAASVGMGASGEEYLYNNPLLSHGSITRRSWFLVPCCPSNLSRTFASLGKYIFSARATEVWVHQYIGCTAELDPGAAVKISLRSGLPWEGNVHLELELRSPVELTFWLRIPSWTEGYTLRVNGEAVEAPNRTSRTSSASTASGYDPRLSWYLPVTRNWLPGDSIELDFSMPVTLRKANPRVKSCRGKAAVTRGPLVYCLEGLDNPGVDLFASSVDPSTLRSVFSPSLLGGTQIIEGKTLEGGSVRFIPYFLWANRGESQMTVWVGTGNRV